MKVYISGPMTGYPEFNYPAFHRAAAYWRSIGHEVVSPAEVNTETDGRWEDYLRTDLRAMLDCEAIALLPGWERSRGANLELHVARSLGMTVIEAWEGRCAPPSCVRPLGHAGACRPTWRSLPRCGAWMPRSQTICARTVGHADGHRSAHALHLQNRRHATGSVAA